MRRRQMIAAHLAAFALFALGGAGAASGQQPIKAKIGQATPALSFLPLYAGRALETFAAEGVDLQWSSIPGGDPVALAALDSGDIDFAAVGAETALQAIAKGQPFQLIYSLMSKMSLELVASKAFLTRAGVKPGDPLEKRIRALKDATLGVSAVRGAQDRAARWLIGQGGLDPARDLKVALIGPPPAIRAAFEKGAIDAFMLSPPEGIIAERADTGRILIRLGDEFSDLKQLHFLVLVVKKPLDGGRLEAARRVARAMIAASERLLADPKGVGGEIHKRFFARADGDVILAAVESLKDGIATKGRMSPRSIEFLLRFATQSGVEFEGNLEPQRAEGGLWSNAVVDAASIR